MAERSPVSMQSSLFVERGVPMRAMEDAIARQVVHGGDLPTNLLEVGGVQEAALLPMLAEATGLEPATSGKLPLPSPTVLRLVPGDLALRHGIFPLGLSLGVLIIATAEPLSAAVEDDLGFALAVEIRQKVAPLARIRQAIADAYQLPLERRFLRLVAKLDDRPDPSPTIVPPRPMTARPPPEPERSVDALASAAQPATQTPKTLVAGTAPARLPTRTKLSAGVEPPAEKANKADLEKTAETNMEALFAAASSFPFPASTPEVAPISPIVSPLAPAPLLTSDEMPETMAAPPEYGAETDEDPVPVSRRSDRLPRRAEQPPRGRALLGVLRRTRGALGAEGGLEGGAEGLPGRERRPALLPTRARRKGPFTTVMAEEELERVTTIESLLDVFFAFAQQFFEYTALFLVQGDMAEGRDASGPGAGPARLMSLAIDLDRPSVLALARERRAPVVAPPAVAGLDAELMQDLGREIRFEGGSRAAVVVLPIVVRHRVVALLLGDDGAADVELSAMGDVIAVAGLTAEHIERAILRKKLGTAGEEAARKRPPRLTPSPDAVARPDARRVGMVALARALELPARPPEQPFEPQKAPDAPPFEIEVTPNPPQVAAAITSPSPFAAPVPVASSVAITLPSASALHPVFAAAAAAAPASPTTPTTSPTKTTAEVSFADVAQGLPASSDAPFLNANVSVSVNQAPNIPNKAEPTEHQGFLDHADEANWEFPSRSRSGPSSRRRRTPLGVVSASARARLVPSTTPPPPFVEAKAGGSMRPSEKVLPAPLPQGLPAPRLAHRRAVAPSFGGRSKASQGLGAQPLPAQPPPNAIAAPPTPPTPFALTTPTAPTAPQGPPAPMRVPPRSEADTPAPPETLPGPPIHSFQIVDPAAARAEAREPQDDPAATVLPPVVATSEAVQSAAATVSTGTVSTGTTPPTLVAPFAPTPVAGPIGGTWTSEPTGSTLPGARVRAPSPDPTGLLQKFLDPNQGNVALFDELVRLGEDAMQAVMARFPGPMLIDPLKARAGMGAKLGFSSATKPSAKDLPPASRCGPLLALIVGIGRPAVPFLVNRSTSGDPDVRFWATHLFAELPFPESGKVVFDRLFDEDASVRRVARRSAALLIAAGPVIEASLLPALDRIARTNGERPGRRHLAIETLGDLALPKVVPVLIAALADGSPDIADAAHRALTHVTRQDFRRDARKWVDWWTTNQSRNRIEWLIDALTHESATIRSAAAEELAPLVHRDLGYYDDLPAEEREVAQARYQLWWEQEGRAAQKKRQG